MVAKRPRRAGIFSGQSLRGHGRPHHSDPALALAAIGGTTYTWDLATDSLTWGPSAAATFGVPAADLPATGRAFNHWIEPRSGAIREDAMALGETAFDLYYALRLGPDRVVLVQDAGRCLTAAEGRPAMIRGYLRADPLAQQHELLPRLVHDRSALLTRLQDDIAEALHHSHDVTLIVCDVLQDDPVDLPEILRQARPLLRRRDHAAALGSHRIALVLTSCSLLDAPDAVRRLSSLLAAEGREIRVASACAPDDALDACTLLRVVENAVAGGETILSRQRGKTTAEPIDLIAALNDRTLALALRPIADAHNHAPLLARAGLAMHGAPASYQQSETSTAILVDGRALELAASHLVAFDETRIILPIAIATLRDPEWLSMLAAHLGARPGIASRLIVALPEAVLVEKTKILGRLDAMKALGIGIALDGFGSGYATFSRLRSLPVDLVTIGGAFIQTLRRSTTDRLFVRSLIDTAQHLGMATAAEWVDNHAASEMLQAWGIDYVEGALFGEATTAAAPVAPARLIRRA